MTNEPLFGGHPHVLSFSFFLGSITNDANLDEKPSRLSQKHFMSRIVDFQFVSEIEATSNDSIISEL